MTIIDWLSILPAMPDAPGGSALASAAVQVQSVWDFVLKGGPIMIPIGLCSLVMLAVVAERLIILRRRRVIPPSFLPGLKKTLDHGDRDSALAYCLKHRSPVANVFAAGIKKLGTSAELIEKHIVEAGQRQVLKLRKNLRVLSVIASVSPLLGLLGTIFGMIKAFETVASTPEALGRTGLLATGIYEAMITTAAGLIVAIPSLVFYHWLSAKVEKLVMDIDHMTVDFIDEIAGPTTGPPVPEGLTPDGHAAPPRERRERAVDVAVKSSSIR